MNEWYGKDEALRHDMDACVCYAKSKRDNGKKAYNKNP